MRTMRNPYTNGMGDASDLLKGVLTAGGGAKLIIRSNVTPEIAINLAQLTKPGAPAETAVEGKNLALMHLIKPEIEITGLGLNKTISPYGRPTAGMFTYVAVGATAAAAIGALIAWKICRG